MTDILRTAFFCILFFGVYSTILPAIASAIRIKYNKKSGITLFVLSLVALIVYRLLMCVPAIMSIPCFQEPTNSDYMRILIICIISALFFIVVGIANIISCFFIWPNEVWPKKKRK